MHYGPESLCVYEAIKIGYNDLRRQEQELRKAIKADQGTHLLLFDLSCSLPKSTGLELIHAKLKLITS